MLETKYKLEDEFLILQKCEWTSAKKTVSCSAANGNITQSGAWSSNIKFRAWLKEKNLMIQWCDTFFSDMSPVTGYGDSIDNENVILMQYIGLEDKDKKEIYKGDIIFILDNCTGDPAVSYIDQEHTIASVEFRNGCFGIIIDKDFINFAVIYSYGIKYLGVIGNIYENSELMEDM